MKVWKLSMVAVCALFAFAARAEDVKVAAVMKDAKVSHTQTQKVEKAKPAAKKAQRKHRDLTPAEWQLEHPQLG